MHINHSPAPTISPLLLHLSTSSSISRSIISSLTSDGPPKRISREWFSSGHPSFLKFMFECFNHIWMAFFTSSKIKYYNWSNRLHFILFIVIKFIDITFVNSLNYKIVPSRPLSLNLTGWISFIYMPPHLLKTPLYFKDYR